MRKGTPVSKSDKPEPPVTFVGLMQSHRRGEILTEGDAAMTDILNAIREFGGKGKLTLTLNIKMNKSGQIEITPDLKSEKPRKAMSTGLYFATEDGALSRRDPNQGDWVDDITPRRDLDS
jgi:hypothetical protein